MVPFLSLWAVKVLPKHCVCVCGIFVHMQTHTYTQRSEDRGGGWDPLAHALFSPVSTEEGAHILAFTYHIFTSSNIQK